MSTTQMPPNDMPALRAVLAACRAQQQLCRQAAAHMAAQDLHIVSRLLTFISRQEAEQAAFLQQLLPAGLQADAAPLPALPQAPEEILRLLIARETAAAEQLLPAARQEAAQADRPRAAAALQRIAETDEGHRARLSAVLRALQSGTLLHSETTASWFCTGCGCVHHGCDAPEMCEGCSRSGSHFIRSDFYPLALG